MSELSEQSELKPCPVCSFHWDMVVMPGEQHNRNCPHADDAEKGCVCQGCMKRFKVDVNIPDDLWNRIRPDGKAEGAGLLCGRCIFARIEALGEFDSLALSHAPVVAPVNDGISWSALLGVLERLRSKNRNPDNQWYHGWNA